MSCRMCRATQNRTDEDSVHLAVLLCRAGLQPLMDLVCGQVKEVQVIFHWVAVPQPVSQADNSYDKQELVSTTPPLLGWKDGKGPEPAAAAREAAGSPGSGR